MSNQNKQHKFRKSLTFKVLCGLVVLLVLGLVYNFIVAADDAPMTEEEQEEQIGTRLILSVIIFGQT